MKRSELSRDVGCEISVRHEGSRMKRMKGEGIKKSGTLEIEHVIASGTREIEHVMASGTREGGEGIRNT